MTTSVLDVTRGAQRPRLASFPPYVSTSGPDAVELAQMAGLELDEWQQYVLEVALGERADTRWSAFEVGLVVPRQNGKGSILEARELAGLFLFGERLILHSAHEYKTAQEAFLRIKRLIEDTPHLLRQVRAMRNANGEQGIELKNGNRLRFVARSKGSGRGFSGDCVILDEAYELTAEQMAALLPTLSSRPNPQLWYASSAGMVTSEQLNRVRARGVAGAEGLAYLEWSAPDDCDPRSHEAVVQANPALGIRISQEFVDRERSAMPTREFARERLGVWDVAVGGAGSAIDPGAWMELADPDAPRGDRPSWGVASDPDGAWAAIAVAWRRPDGAVQVMLTDYHATRTWVASRFAELRERWGGDVAVDVPSRGIVPGARELGLAEQAQAHNALADAVLARKVRHGNEPALNVAVRASRWHPTGETRVLERKGTADVSPIIAAALAAWQATRSVDVLEAIW